MSDSIKATWSIFRREGDQFFVTQTIDGDRGFTEYGPIDTEAGAEALIVELRVVFDRTVRRHVQASHERFGLTPTIPSTASRS